jgi:hypothetical protein
MCRRKHVLVIGDSHVKVVSKLMRSEAFNRFFMLDFCAVGGATAQGMINPNSKSDALNIFKERLKSARAFQHIVFQLGEVDCGFVIWYYAEKFNIEVGTQMQRSLSNYSNFLFEVKEMGFSNLHVLSAPLPTIEDGQDWGDIAKKRSEILTTKKERTNLTILYNSELKKICYNLGIQFIDHTSSMLDVESGLIRKDYVHKNPNNHHLDASAYGRILSESFKRIK